MLCVTGNETTIDALASRLARVDAQLGGAEFLQEVRLDALTGPLDDAFDLLQRYGSNLVVCCRPPSQGGQFEGSEADRMDILNRAVRRNIAYLDLELETSVAGQETATKGHQGKLILSEHYYQSPAPPPLPVVQTMQNRGADIAKIAAKIEDAAEFRTWLTQRHSFPSPTILIGMGLAGMLSRLRYTAFGSPWTYVSAENDVRTAPGQLSLEESLAYGLPESAGAPFLALVGGPSVAYSPGPRVYNSLFRARGLPWQYLAIQTSAAPSTFDMLHGLGALGLSVTMPHKNAAFGYGQRSSDAERIGSANTISFAGSVPEVTNTDLWGVRAPLQLAMVGSKIRRAMVLGGGGAARAAVAACVDLGLVVTVAVRRPEEARKWLPEDVGVIAFDERGHHSSEVLINATPLGGVRSPWDGTRDLHARIVFDLALSDAPSRLLQQATEAKAVAIAPIEMWLAQGARQLRRITGVEVSEEELRKHLPL